MSSYKLPITHHKLLVLLGPTSSGKSELAVKLAKRFNGEIISCDSRQVYRGMNLGTGKVGGNWKPLPIARHPERAHPRGGSLKQSIYVYKSIPHHLIDFVNPARQYSAAHFQRNARKAIADILRRGRLPILCGGAAQYIDAVVYNQNIPNVKPNLKLRARLEKQSADVLFRHLIKLDPVRANSLDPRNKRRLIRALEIVLTTGSPVPPLGVIPSATEGSQKRDSSPSDALGFRMTPKSVLWLGLTLPQKTLYKKIDARLKQHLKAGMIKEVRHLHTGFRASPRKIPRQSALSWRRLESFGLEYRYISQYLQNKISKDEMLTQLSLAIKHYSQRQMTWWKKNKDIIWIKPNTKKAEKITKQFLK